MLPAAITVMILLAALVTLFMWNISLGKQVDRLERAFNEFDQNFELHERAQRARSDHVNKELERLDRTKMNKQ